MPRKHTPALQQKGVGFLTKGHQKSHPPRPHIYVSPLQCLVRPANTGARSWEPPVLGSRSFKRNIYGKMRPEFSTIDL